ncbi:MAG: YheC/YheD family protein [Oscillospiraceae bacterium]|nr:YheC/YheD family protein [Oscillospiraceae bacterium]
MLIGYMHYRKSPAELNRAYAFAATAKAEGAELLYFSPGSVDSEKGIINGYKYAAGEWISTVSRYPDVIYNTTGFSGDKQNQAVKSLQQEVPFTSFSIGSKTTVYRNLMTYKKYSDYLVLSEKVLSNAHFFAFMEKHPEVVFKPAWGHQGMGVYYVKKAGYEFILQSSTEETTHNAEEMADFILNKIDQDEYIMQPYLNCRTKAGVPYDLRLHVQKGDMGKWMPPIIYPRISSNDSIVCNIGQGGYTSDLTSFLTQEFGKRYYDIRKYIEMFSLQFAVHMDEIQNDLYDEALSELGIDIGLDENQKIFIYEVNWRPGHPPFNNINLSVVRNTVRYAMYLVNKNSEGI